MKFCLLKVKMNEFTFTNGQIVSVRSVPSDYCAVAAFIFHLVGGESRNINLWLQRRLWREKNAIAAAVHSILDHWSQVISFFVILSLKVSKDDLYAKMECQKCITVDHEITWRFNGLKHDVATNWPNTESCFLMFIDTV